MPGLDYPEAGSSKLAIAMWAFEWPLSVLRWLSIPSSDGEWSRKRRLWTAATPPMASLVFATGLLFDGEAPSYSPFVATMLGSVGGGEGGFPNMVLVMLLSTSLCPLLYLLSVDNKPPRFQAGLVVCGFAMTIVWLKIIASEMIALIETFGHLFGVSTSILGLTVIAIGNSIGDFVADTAAAREGTVSGTRMAIAATFGSPVIMNIVSVGLSFTLRLAITGFQPICFASVSLVTRLGYILFYVTIFSHLAVFPLCGYKAPRAYAVYLFGIYGLLCCSLASSRWAASMAPASAAACHNGSSTSVTVRSPQSAAREPPVPVPAPRAARCGCTLRSRRPPPAGLPAGLPAGAPSRMPASFLVGLAGCSRSFGRASSHSERRTLARERGSGRR